MSVLSGCWLLVSLAAMPALAQDSAVLEINRVVRAGDRSRLRERAALLRDSIRNNPREARKLLLSEREANQVLAADPSAQVERWEIAVSTNIWIADDFEHKRSAVIYDAPGFQGYQDGPEAPGAKCGDTVRISGYRIGDTMLVTEAVVRERGAETPACNPVGPQKLAIIYARVPGLGAPPVTIEQLRSFLFEGELSAPAFWSISSFGLAPFTGEVIGPVDVDRQYGCNDATALQLAAYNAAAKLTDMTQYNRIFVAHPGLGPCVWGGGNSVGCILISGTTHRTSLGSMNTAGTLTGIQRYVFHEVGHGLGLRHSNAYIAPGETLGADRSRTTVLEYGDQYSAMGSGNASTYGLGQKEILGWLKEGDTIQTVTKDVNAELLPMGLGGGGLRGLKVKRNTQAGNEYVWVEYRTRAGTDVALPALQPGAILHYSPTQVDLTGELLDATPGNVSDNDSYIDPVLPAGRKWTDKYSDVSIEVTAATPDKLSVSVRYGKPCATLTWPASKVIPTEGGSFRPEVTATGECQVTSSGNNYWIQPDAPGSANFVAAPNTTTMDRTGTVTVDRQTITVTQRAVKADLEIESFAPVSGTLVAGSFSQFLLNVTAANGSNSIGEVRVLLGETNAIERACLLVYKDGLMRLMNDTGTGEAGTLRSGVAEQTGNRQCSIATFSLSNMTPSVVRLSFFISPNAVTYFGPKKLFVGMRHSRDTQLGPFVEVGSVNVASGCQAVLIPPRAAAAGPGGILTATVNVTAGCPWDAATASDWVRISLNRTLAIPVATFTVAANTSSANRRATVKVLGAEFVIDQAGAGQPIYPNVSFDGTEVLIARAGGQGELFFTTNLPAAQVNPATGQSWLRLNFRLSPNASIGSSVLYYAEPNLTPAARFATIRVGPTSIVAVQEAGPDDPGRNMISTLAGSGSGDGPDPLNARVPRPSQLAYDRNGDLYIAEPDYYRVRKLAKDGTLATVAGIGAPGEPLYDGPASQSRLLAVRGITVDSRSNLYISMSGDIGKVAPDGTFTRFASQLGTPTGLCVDDKDNVYVADSSSHRVWMITPGGTVSPFAGTGAAGYSGDGGAPLSALLRNPSSIAWARDGSFYISDTSNFAVRKISGGRIDTVIGNGASGNTMDGNTAKGQQITAPGQLAVDAAGLVYFVLTGGRVRHIDAGGKAATFAGGGSATANDASVATNVTLDAQGVAFDPSSTDPQFAISDGILNAVRRVDAAGKIGRLAGRLVTGTVNDGPAASASLYWPLFGTFGPDGALYFSENRNQRIRRLNSDGTVETVAGNGGRFQPSEGVPARNTGMSEPAGVAFDKDGNLIYADSSNQRIRRIGAGGVVRTMAGTGAFGFAGDNAAATTAAFRTPRGLAVDAAGNIYIADSGNHRIRVIEAATGLISTAVGTGMASFGGDGGMATAATLNNPQAVAFDTAGNLFIADSGNFRVRMVGGDGIITTIAGNGKPSGGSSLALSAAIGFAGAIAIGPDGSIYTTDTTSHQVNRILPDGILQVIVGNGVAGFSGDGGPGWSATTFAPMGLAVDAGGNLIVFDTRNDRIRVIAAN